MDDRSDQLWRGVAGQRAAKPPTAADQALSTMLAAGVSKADIAAQLGVSLRTVERWTTTTGQQRRDPGRSKHASRIVDAAGKHPRVRAAAASSRRAARHRNRGARLRIKGQQGPAPSGKAYRRQRTIERYLDGDTMDAIQQAWQSGDDAAVEDLIREALEDEGYPAWDWDDGASVDFLAEHRE
jgi:uncharacterized protein YjcR